MLVYERRILKRIQDPVKPEEGWGIRNNEELEKLMRGEDIVKYVRIQRIKWWGYLNRMEKTRTVWKITELNPTGMRSKEHPKKTDGEMGVE
jgi:hypothetical protein